MVETNQHKCFTLMLGSLEFFPIATRRRHTKESVPCEACLAPKLMDVSFGHPRIVRTTRCHQINTPVVQDAETGSRDVLLKSPLD